MTIKELLKKAYASACKKGWHDTERSPLEYHMLIVSEIAEATEEVRKGTPPIYQIYSPDGDDQNVRELKIKGHTVLVDNRDFKKIENYGWYVSFDGASHYLKANKQGSSVSYHSMVVNPPDGMMVDHIDGNTLNNLRHNLRVCSASQNQANQKKQKRQKTSQYKGVCFYPRANKWKAQIGYEGSRLSLGYFNSEEDAARAYDVAATGIFGKFAKLNLSNPDVSEIEITPSDFRWDKNAKCEGEAIELADTVIRIADYCASRGWDLEKAIKEKMKFNEQREYRHGNKLF